MSQRQLSVEEDGRIRVRLPYGDPLGETFKNMIGASWDREDKSWTISPASARDVLAAIRQAPDLSEQPAVADIRRLSETTMDRYILSFSSTPGDDRPLDLAIPLRPYQKAAVDYIEQAGGHAILGDEDGIGKTVEALAAVEAMERYPAIVVCPGILVEYWREETLRVLPARTVAAWYQLKEETPDWVIVSEAAVGREWADLRGRGFQSVVLDGSNATWKSGQARWDALKEMGKAPVAIWIERGGETAEMRASEIIVIDRMKEFGDEKGYKFQEILQRESREKIDAMLRERCLIGRTKRDVRRDMPSGPVETVVPLKTFDKEKFSQYRESWKTLAGYVQEWRKEQAFFRRGIASESQARHPEFLEQRREVDQRHMQHIYLRMQDLLNLSYDMRREVTNRFIVEVVERRGEEIVVVVPPSDVETWRTMQGERVMTPDDYLASPRSLAHIVLTYRDTEGTAIGKIRQGASPMARIWHPATAGTLEVSLARRVSQKDPEIIESWMADTIKALETQTVTMEKEKDFSLRRAFRR